MSKIDKAIKVLGVDTVTEMDGMSSETLKKRVVEASEAMRQVDEELEANDRYQQIKEDLKAITSGKREVDKRQKAVIVVALQFLKDKGAE